MKNIVKILFAFVITGIAVIFAIGYMFDGSIAGGNGLFQGIGNILSVSTSNRTNTLPELQENMTIKAAPEVVYIGAARQVGESVQFKSMFTVKTENGEKNGTVEDDFAIYLSDIRSRADVSVIEFLTTEQIEALEEIPSAFIYDEETDTLYCFKSGVYTVYIKVYGSNGTQEEYEFLLPVEVQ